MHDDEKNDKAPDELVRRLKLVLPESANKPKLKSKLAQDLNDWADALDAEIEMLLRL